MSIADSIFPSSWEDKEMNWEAPNPHDRNYWMALYLAMLERQILLQSGLIGSSFNDRFFFHSLSNCVDFINEFNRIVIGGMSFYDIGNGLAAKYIPQELIDNYHFDTSKSILANDGIWDKNKSYTKRISTFLKDANILQTPLFPHCTVYDIGDWMKRAKAFLDKMVNVEVGYTATKIDNINNVTEDGRGEGYSFVQTFLHGLDAFGTHQESRDSYGFFVGFGHRLYHYDDYDYSYCYFDEAIPRFHIALKKNRTPKINVFIAPCPDNVVVNEYYDVRYPCKASLLGVSEQYGIKTDLYRRDGDMFVPVVDRLSLRRDEYIEQSTFSSRQAYGFSMFVYSNWDCEGGFRFRPSTANGH